MRHFLTILSNCFVQNLGKQMSKVDLWTDGKDSIKVRENLRNALNICRRWSTGVEQLTNLFWKNFAPHRWKGETFKSIYFLQFEKRLEKLSKIRSAFDQATRLGIPTNKMLFSSFENLNIFQVNSSNETQWNAAVSHFEHVMIDVDRQVVKKLRERLQTNSSQNLIEFRRFADLIEREQIRRDLTAERETILVQIENDLRSLTDDFTKMSSIDSTRQIEAKVKSKRL